jgi:(E)-4-hydroxy-3-methylbut-2-enyl-diphosphate synthase
VDEFLTEIQEPIRVAVMGCEVNGPGEAKDADVGLAAGRGAGMIFRKGRKIRRVAEAEMLEELKKEILQVIEDRKNGILDDEPDALTSRYKPVLTLTPV